MRVWRRRMTSDTSDLGGAGALATLVIGRARAGSTRLGGYGTGSAAAASSL